MRRLPVYLLLDTSTSMLGEPIEAVKNGVQLLLSTLRQDPYALETAYLSVISFNTTAKQVVPLTELATFQMPNLEANGMTELGEALSLLASCIDREITRTTADTKGDWKPLIFIMTDGTPTDEWERGVADLKNSKTGIIIACAAGQDADISVLSQITEAVVQLNTADSQTIAAFFKWVSSSISTSSQKVDLNKKEVSVLSELPPPPPEVNVAGL